MTALDADIDPRTPREELIHRYSSLRKRLAPLDIDLTVVLTNPNLFYLTGSIQEGILALSNHHSGPVYMVRRVLERARYESHLDDVRPAVSPKKLQETLGLRQVKSLGMELDSVPVVWAERVRSAFGGHDVEIVDISHVLRETRAVKSAWEVDRIVEGAAQIDTAMERAREVIREGMTELELSAELEFAMRRMGHEGLVRMHRFNSEMHIGGVLSGPSATRPTWHQAVMGGGGLSPSLPHGASDRKIRKGEPIAIDLCGISHGYIADETRTFVVGTLSERVMEVQQATQEILSTLESELRPGVHNEGLWIVAETMAEELGVLEGFMGVGDTKMRFIGHGVGLELDELPIMADRVPGEVPVGAVVALEPKVVIPELGVLGEENTYHVTKDGARQLTWAPPGPIEV